MFDKEYGEQRIEQVSRIKIRDAELGTSVGWSSPRTTEDQGKDQDWTAKDQDHTVVFVSPVLVLVLVLCTFKFCRTTQDQSGPVLDWSI